MVDIKTVKMDLRRIKYGKKHLTELTAEQDKKVEYLRYLRGCRQTKQIRERIKAFERIVEERGAELTRKMSELDVLFAMYDDAICALSEVDQVIIREGYIGGTPYWQIGKQLGYSERGIQERMVRIFEAIAAAK